MTKQTVCLNMIVKDEARVIVRALESLAPHVSCAVILDTGSTDGTPALIRDTLARLNIPGQVHEAPFEDFATTRNKALDLARVYLEGDPDAYILFHDADDEMVYEPDGRGFARLTADAYDVRHVHGQFEYHRKVLVRAAKSWYWDYPYHEVLACDEPHTTEYLPCVWVRYNHDGSRPKDPQSHIRPARLLVEHFQTHGKPRAAFYAAQEFYAAGHAFDAIAWYKRRIQTPGGWEDEVYYSWYMIGLLETQVGACLMALNMAINLRPWRLEPYWAAVALAHKRGWNEMAKMYLDAGVKAMGAPDRGGLFVDTSARKGLAEWWRTLYPDADPI